MSDATGAPIGLAADPYGSRPLAVLALAATAAAAGSLWLCYRAVQRADAATGELDSARRELTSAEERVASLERLVSERESSIKELSGKVEALKTSLEGAVGEARSSRSRMFMMERELKQTNGLVRRLQEADQSGYDEDRHEW